MSSEQNYIEKIIGYVTSWNAVIALIVTLAGGIAWFKIFTRTAEVEHAEFRAFMQITTAQSASMRAGFRHLACVHALEAENLTTVGCDIALEDSPEFRSIIRNAREEARRISERRDN